MTEDTTRSGADGPVDGADLAAAHGMDPDNPAATERFDEQLEAEGKDAAVADALSQDRIRANEPGTTRAGGWASDQR